MAAVTYRIVVELPPEVQTPRFLDLPPGQVRLRIAMVGDEVQVIACGDSAAACENLLRQLGATEIGVDLCG